MDLITDLPKSKGFDSILSVVDHGLTKGIILIPTTKGVTSEGITILLMDNLFQRFGIPDKVISDCNPQFIAKSMKAFLQGLGIKQAISTAFHPQSDSTMEQFNQEIKLYLAIYCADNPETQANKLPMAKYSHNSRLHEGQSHICSNSCLDIPQKPTLTPQKPHLSLLTTGSITQKTSGQTLNKHMKLPRISLIRESKANFPTSRQEHKSSQTLDTSKLKEPQRSWHQNVQAPSKSWKGLDLSTTS